MAIVNLSIEFADSYIETIKAFMVSRANDFTGGITMPITNAQALIFIEQHFQKLADRFSLRAIEHAETSEDVLTLPVRHQTALSRLETAQSALKDERNNARSF